MEHEQLELDLGIEDAARLVQENGGVFVDGRKPQAVCCFRCGTLLLAVCKETYG